MPRGGGGGGGGGGYISWIKVMGTIASQLTPCPKTHLKAA